MEEEDDKLRVYSLLRSPLPSHVSEGYTYNQDNTYGGLTEETDTVYENLRYQYCNDDEKDSFDSCSVDTEFPEYDRVDNSNQPENRDHTDLGIDSSKGWKTELGIPRGRLYRSLPKSFSGDYVRVGRKFSDANDSDIDNITPEKVTYKQQLRKSSLIHISDTNSIPVLEGLRQWASYRRISRQKSCEHPTETRELYDTPYETLNPWLTHRRAPRSYPELPKEWVPIQNPSDTKVTPLEAYNGSDIASTAAVSTENNTPSEKPRVPPRKPPPRKNILKKKTKPILKRKISITKNDLKSNVAQPEADRPWLTELKRLHRNNDSANNLGKDQSPSESSSEEEKTPFFYCRLIADFPKTCFVVTLCGHLLIMLLTVILLLIQYDLFPTDFDNLPMYDWSVPWRRRDLAWRFRDDYSDRYVRKLYLQSLPKWYRAIEYDRGNIVLFYDAIDENIYTKEKLERMHYIEKAVTAIPEYRQYCVQDASLRCLKPKSVLRYFDGTYANINPMFYDPKFERISAVLYTAANDNRTKKQFALLLAKDHTITAEYAHASLARSIIPLGFPLKDFKEIKPMENQMQHFLANSFKPVISDLTSNTKGFALVYWSYLLFLMDIAKQASRDMSLALGSVIFIYCFIVYHTKSLWISSFAVMSIATSFLTANMIYRIVLDFRYFGLFHIIAIFIILGIGADDLFVFLDVWKNTAFNKYPSLAHRLTDAYKRAVSSMLITSLTTVIAFFASSFSPLLPAKTFGVFAGLLVIVNYISVVIFFPTVVIMHHIYFKDCKWPCLHFSLCVSKPTVEHTKKEKHKSVNCFDSVLPCARSISSDEETDGISNRAFELEKEMEYGFFPVDQSNPDISYIVLDDDAERLNRRSGLTTINVAHNITTTETVHYPERLKRKSGLTTINVAHNITTTETVHYPEELSEVNNVSAGAINTKEKKLLVRFFRDYFFKIVTHSIARWIIVLCLSALVIFMTYSAVQLESDTEQVQYYRSGHNYGKALFFNTNGFVSGGADINGEVYIVWGLHPRDMSGCHFSDVYCEGVERYDETFDPNTPEAQLALMNFCDTLLNFSPHEIQDFHIRRDLRTGQPEIRCFMKELQDFLRKESVATGVDWSLPWDYTKTLKFMWSRPQLYDTSKLDRSFKEFLQIPISYWLNDGYRYWNRTGFHTYHPLIGEATGPFSSPLKMDYTVFYGNKIQYLAMQVNLTLGRFSTGYSTGKPVMDRWENFVSSKMRQMPNGMQRGFQLTRSLWHTLSIQKTMADNAIFGIVLGILCALPILTLATRNIIIGFFATFSMCCTTVCVIGMIPLAGWKLGILESLNMCMVVGLSVDYVVHLAEGYYMSTHSDRMSRVRDMLEEVGISVFSGACTTLGASIFMLFAQIQFLVKFGLFMLCTIGFSLIFSLGFFTTIMGLLGPSGNTGDIKLCCNKLLQWRKRDTASKNRSPQTQSSIEAVDSER